VAHPCEATALEGAVEAAQKGLIAPLLVGPAAKIKETAASSGIDLGNLPIVDVPHSHASATKAVELIRAPDLEAGNILAKQLSFLANADSAGMVLGAKVPVILTSRADSVRSRIASCAVAKLVAHARRAKP
jgi:phosphotransacetylase